MKLISRLAVILLAVLSLAGLSFAADASSLKPPPGSKVAIVMFEDLECPDCARAYPVVLETAKAHKIPVVLHDFPLHQHPWSFEAAVYARYFDTMSQELGDDFRGYIFKNQPNISAGNLRTYVQKFADEKKVPLPFAVDPMGTLKAKVQEDFQLGQRMNLEHTPTIFVIGNGGPSTPFVEVVDRQQLSQIVEDMQKKAGPASSAPVKRASAKKK